MWIYEKKLEYPVKIKQTNPALSQCILTQFGGTDGELAASLRYLSQKFDMVTPQAKAILNDIATEELAHLEMIGSMCLQLSENATPEEIKKSGFDKYYVDHGKGIYPASAAGVPFTAAYLQSAGDPISNLYEDMAAEQKARSTYEYIINLTDDPDVLDPLRFLREREIVHFQRFGEALRIVQDYMDSKRQFIIKKPDYMKNADKNCESVNGNESVQENDNSCVKDAEQSNNNVRNYMKNKQHNFDNKCRCRNAMKNMN